MPGCRNSRLPCPSEQCKARWRSAKESQPSSFARRTAEAGCPHMVLLVPHCLAGRAGPSGAGTSGQRCRAERTDHIRGWRDLRKPLAERWFFQRTEQVHKKQNRRRRCGDSEDPTDGPEISDGRDFPQHHRSADQDNQSRPFEGSASPRVDVRITITGRALPVFPEAHGQDWDPEDVPHIEGAESNGSARRLAREAVVIAESNPLRPEMVGAVNDEHGGFARGCSAVY